MQVTRRHGRKALALGILCAGGFGAFGLHGKAEAPADADVFAVRGTLNLTSTLTFNLGNPDRYTVGSDVHCAPIPAGPTSVPGFIDATGQSGECTGVSGFGFLTLAQCSTGLMTAEWDLPEPASTSAAHFSGSGVVVGGIAVLAGPPVVGGYADESASGAGFALGTLAVPSPDRCGANTNMILTAVVAGAY